MLALSEGDIVYNKKVYKYFFSEDMIARDGPFEEFRQDASIVSIELDDGKVLDGVLLVHPYYLAVYSDGIRLTDASFWRG